MSLVGFCTTCKGRLQHLRETLPKNMADNPDAKFIVLDYSSQDGLSEYLLKEHRQDLDSGKLAAYSIGSMERQFHMAHAKNTVMRAAIREGADIVCTIDADNFTGRGLAEFIVSSLKPGTWLCPDYETIQKLPFDEKSDRPLRGFAGRMACLAQDFVKAGGYDESYDTWRGEDIDFNARMSRMGYKQRFIDNRFLKVVPHPAEVRFKEYPHARQYDFHGGWKIEGNETNTVVNYGKLGVGVVYRNYDPTPIKFEAMPTRIFGIGLHKTATRSLDKAFQILGFDSLHWGSGEAALIWQEVHAAGRSKTLERFYAACDLPIPLLYKKLDATYPGSKFVLTLRDESQWIKSVERLWDPAFNPTRWEWDVWPISNRLHKALYGRTDFNAETMLQRYRQHNAEVLDYFKDRPNDLLVMHLNGGNGWAGLPKFLGVPEPAQPYPKEGLTRPNFNKCPGSNLTKETKVMNDLVPHHHKMQRRARGAFATPRHELAAATPHRIETDTPKQVARIPPYLSFWLNYGKGDCCLAEEAFAKACFGVFINDRTVLKYGQQRGILQGSTPLRVIQYMQQEGFHQGGKIYGDGKPTSVDWMDQKVLNNAISVGPVKLGVVAEPLEDVVGSTNGWFAGGFKQTKQEQEDHCVGVSGFGTIAYLFDQLKVQAPPAALPFLADPGYLIFTWCTMGIIDVPSFQAITWEAWLRTPTTVIQG